MAGKEKLLADIAAYRNGEEMTKGNKTAYGQVAHLSDEEIAQYIEEAEADGKKPNVKKLIAWKKSQFIQRGYKVQLYPTPEQEALLMKHVDAYRWTYNYLYADRQRTYQQYYEDRLQWWVSAEFDPNDEMFPDPPKWKADYKLVSQQSGNQPEWFGEDISCQVIIACCRSFPKKPSGFRSKSKSAQEFLNDQGDQIKIDVAHIELSKLGKLKHSCPNYIPQDQKVCSIGISYYNGKWYAGVSILLDKKKPALKTHGKTIGVDVGARKTAAIWDGEKLSTYNRARQADQVERIVRLERQKAIWQRRADRRFKKGATEQSKRYELAQDHIRRLHAKIANIRHDNTHQISDRILRHDVKKIVVEDLNTAGMLAKGKPKPNAKQKLSRRKLRKSLREASMGSLLEQLKYKSSWRGIEFQEADRFFPSSKLCSMCHIKTDIDAGEHWTCSNCGTSHNRDENAAKNLQAYKITQP